MVVPPAFPAQQHINTPKAVADPRLGDIPDPLPYGKILPAVCPVIPDRGAQQRYLAHPAKGNTVRYQADHHLPALGRLQNVF